MAFYHNNVPGEAPAGYITSFMGWTPTGNWGMRFQWNYLNKDGVILVGDSEGYSSHRGAAGDLLKFLRSIP